MLFAHRNRVLDDAHRPQGQNAVRYRGQVQQSAAEWRHLGFKNAVVTRRDLDEVGAGTPIAALPWPVQVHAGEKSRCHGATALLRLETTLLGTEAVCIGLLQSKPVRHRHQ